MRKKIESYLGFCLRAGKILFGVDAIEKQRKGVKLLIVDDALGESSLKSVVKAQEKFGCPLIAVKEGVLADMLHKSSVKAIAVKDASLATAIVKETENEEEFTLNCGGHKEIYGKERL